MPGYVALMAQFLPTFEKRMAHSTTASEGCDANGVGLAAYPVTLLPGSQDIPSSPPDPLLEADPENQ